MEQKEQNSSVEKGKDPDKTRHGLTNDLRGEYMAFAFQSGLYQLAANVYEPYINHRVQRYFAKSDPAHLEEYGNYKQNFLGEIIGDITGAGTLMLAEALCPGPLHICVRKFRDMVDPLYTPIAKHVFRDQKDDPDYEAKMKDWKVYQERNLARALIVATGGITGNVLAQKYIVGNPAPMKYVLAGKLLSTTLTTGLNMGSRMMFPEKTEQIDGWLGDKIFKPMLKSMDNTPDIPEAKTNTDELAAGGEGFAQKIENEKAGKGQQTQTYPYNTSPYAPPGAPLSFSDRFAMAGGHSIPESNLSYAQRLQLDSKQQDRGPHISGN